LKYRKSAKLCLENAKEILRESEVVNEMPVSEWLDRQNLIKYMGMFTKHRVYTVKEIKHYVDDSGSFNESFKFKDT
jgi:replicative DNA helicase